MVSFLIIQDQNQERRFESINKLRSQIAPFSDLEVQVLHHGSVSVIWAASLQAPISLEQGEQGFSILWGEALVPRESKRLSAAELREHWQTESPPFDGYYAATTYDSSMGIKVGVDVLGCFPLYYFSCQEAVIIGTSPELFHAHPLCTRELSLEGLVGLLMTKRIVNGQSLWNEVYRLEAGNLLKVSPDNLVSEEVQYRLPCRQADIEQAGYYSLPYDEQLEILENALDEAIKRHIPSHESHTFLLSGGLDSRTLCGFLHKHRVPVTALTWGRNSDLEAMSARSLAKICDWPHHIRDILPEHKKQMTEFAVDYEHVSAWGGSLTGTVWSRTKMLEDMPPRVVTGLLMDAVICGLYRYSKKSFSYEDFMEYERSHGGLSLEQIEPLLKVDNVRTIFNRVKIKLSKRYQAYSDIPELRLFAAILIRSRIKLGIHLWRMSFSAWPRVTILDQSLLAVSVQLPLQTTSRRKAQKELVRRAFPNLARVPIDANGFKYVYLDTSSLSTSNQFLSRVRSLVWKAQKKLGWERRYYYRLYNANHKIFRNYRESLNKSKEFYGSFFDLQELDRYLPSEERINFDTDPIQESRAIFIMMNFFLWLRHHNAHLCVPKSMAPRG